MCQYIVIMFAKYSNALDKVDKIGTSKLKKILWAIICLYWKKLNNDQTKCQAVGQQYNLTTSDLTMQYSKMNIYVLWLNFVIL